MKASLASLTIALIGMATAFLTAQPYAQDEDIKDMQSMLADCGFDPGPLDGLWGVTTAGAASDYIQAYGGSPTTDDQAFLMAQVDAYHISDGPCPADHGATGPVEQPEGAPHQIQAREPEFTLEAVTTELSRTIEQIVTLQKEAAAGLWYDRPQGVFNNVWIRGYSDDNPPYKFEVYLPDVASVHWSPSRDWVYVFCYPSDRTLIHGTEYPVKEKWNEIKRNVPVGAEWCGNRPMPVYNYPQQGRQLADDLYDSLTQLAHLNASRRVGSASGCLEWADLGGIATGAWRNAYGNVAKGLNAGDLGKAWNRAELVKKYEASHEHCLSNNESAMRQATAGMVVVGRLATDVEDEKTRIRDYFQGKVNECQSEFLRRFHNVEHLMCE